MQLPEAFAVNGAGLPEKLFTLRQKLYRKAKREPTFRFYTLYGLIARFDVLEAAWALVAANDGAPGVDGVTIAALKTSPAGVAQLVQQLQDELQTKQYRPQAVRRVYIPKADGKQRPLGIPTVRDRVVQTAAKLILEPIFEADFLEVSFGYRPGRTAHDALKVIARQVQRGYHEIYDADLAAYFDSIPQEKLLKCVERRVADRQVLRLLRRWLTAPSRSETKTVGRADSDRPRERRRVGSFHRSWRISTSIGWMCGSHGLRDRARGRTRIWCGMRMTLSYWPATWGSAFPPGSSTRWRTGWASRSIVARRGSYG